MSDLRRAKVRQTLRSNSDDLLRYFERRVEIREDAADLLGETMLTVWRRSADLPQDDEEQRMWLFGIAGHMMYNHRRSIRRRSALGGRLREALSQVESDPIDSEQTIAVQEALKSLTPSHAELVRLVHWDGFNLADAARILGINASTARSRYSAAREQLKRILLVEMPERQNPKSEHWHNAESLRNSHITK